jgi:hypothetical protein
MGEWAYTSTHSEPRILVNVGYHLYASVLTTVYPLTTKLAGQQSQSIVFREEKHLLSLTEIEPALPGRAAHSYESVV